MPPPSLIRRALAHLGLGTKAAAPAGAGPGGALPLSGFSAGWPVYRGTSAIPAMAPTTGPEYLNPVVGACIHWLQRNFPVPDLVVVQDGGPDDGAEIDGHALPKLLDRPNELQDFFGFTSACVMSDVAWGETFLLKRRDGRGRVLDLWWLDPAGVVVVPDPTRARSVLRYEFRSGEVYAAYDPAEVVHIVAQPDPANPRRGLSCLATVRASVRIIDQLCIYDEAVLVNSGASPGVFAPADPKEVISQDDVEYLRQQFMERQTGRNAGKPIFSPFGIGFTKTAFSPEELALDKLPRRHVSYICAAIGLSPMVLGYEDDSKSYANYAESARAAYENCLMPMQARWAEALNHDPDLIAEGERAKWDYSHVSYLRDDRGKTIHSLVEAVAGGVLTADEARGELHYPPKDDEPAAAAPAPAPAAPAPPDSEAADAAGAIGAHRVAALIAANANGSTNGKPKALAPTDDEIRVKTAAVLDEMAARLRLQSKYNPNHDRAGEADIEDGDDVAADPSPPPVVAVP